MQTPPRLGLTGLTMWCLTVTQIILLVLSTSIVCGSPNMSTNEDASARHSETEITQVLERYRQAYEQKNLEGLEHVYDTMTTAQREANSRYFQNTHNLTVTIRDVYIDVRGDEAIASYTREDKFIDPRTGQNVQLDVRFTKTFVLTDNVWRMVVKKK